MDIKRLIQNEASVMKIKPALPIKQVKSIYENNVNRTTHVRDIVRKLQEKSNDKNNSKTPNYIKATKNNNNKKTVTVTVQDEGNNQTNKTIEDIKAIDADIDKLRRQIEERDKVIIALREAAEAKDKKLENILVEYSKLQTNAITKSSEEISPSQNRGQESNVPSSIPTSPSPPLCNGELCWTDGFVNKNYHEPVYAQLLNDHTALQKVCNDLKEKLELKTKEMERLDNETMSKAQENGINLIMAEQIRILKEREAQLMSEAEELREQNDLMEFRILELEECRKEEMLNESKQRSEKIIWSERDLEDVSDSGVMSLPTSEDFTSDSELSDTIRNYLSTDNASKPASPENSCNESTINDLKHKKLLKSTECLQESGIFEDSEISTDSAIKYSKSCQTESYLDKTLLEIIDSSCDIFLSKNPGYLDEKCKKSKSDDLTTEISKLSEIQKRIQEKKEIVHELPTPTKKSSSQIFTCPHSKSIIFYEERLSQLEDKIKIYESSGDTKELLLAKRLEKEIDLAHRVEELTERVVLLEVENQRLEEEKCEFEEAENDSRFQCQRLEIKLQELIEKNAELELEVERQRNIMADGKRRGRRKGTLEGLVDHYEQRNFELEEKEIEARQKLNMIETAMPAILAYNLYRICQSEKGVSTAPSIQRMIGFHSPKKELTDEAAVYAKLDELIEDQKKLRREYEKAEEAAELRETILRKRIEELEEKALKDRDLLESMSRNLKESEESIGSIQSGDLEVFEELKQLVENEVKMREKIEELEKKEKAYMDTLQQADEIWAGMEADYKKKLEDADNASKELREKIEKLKADREETNRKLKEALKENKTLKESAKVNDGDLGSRVKELEAENSRLKFGVSELQAAVKKLEDELEATKKRFSQEKLVSKKLGEDLENKNKNWADLEIKFREQINHLTQELIMKSKEISCLEVTVAELKEEVETLESKVLELVGTIDNLQPSVSNARNSCALNMNNLDEPTIVPEEGLETLDEPNILPSLPEMITLKMDNFVTAPVVNLSPVRVVPAEVRIPGKIVSPTNLVKEEKENFPPEDELAKLSIESIKLLKIFEEEEKESQIKSQELEDLREKAKILKKEQERLAECLGVVKTQLGPCDEDEIEFVEPCGEIEMMETITNLQVAAVNLQNKCRMKNNLINAFLEEINTKGNDSHISLNIPGGSKSLLDFDQSNVYQYLKDSSPLKMANILSSTCKGSSTFVSSANSNESFTPSDVVPITGLRKIDSASFLLEWDIRKRGSDVTGYEVYIDGDLHQKVRSSNRNRALLHTNDMNHNMLISVYTVTNRGRSASCSFINFPDKILQNKSDNFDNF